MTRKTVFCVQPFELKGKSLSPTQLRQFKHEDEARRAGERVGQTAVGALVYSIEGDAEWDDWSPPVVLARHGELPEIEF